MKASSVREAQQSLGIPVVAFFLFIGFVLPEILETMPDTVGTAILSQLAGTDPLMTLLVVTLILLATGGGILLIIASKFTRPALLENQ